jgi:acetyl-CoA carboxylase alpha subunit
METDQLIAAEKFCTYYNVTLSFVHELHEIGLIETIIVEETEFIQIPHLQKIERIIRLHDDLNINLEGIEVVDTLLNRMEKMQREMQILRNKLSLYEPF